MQTKYVLGLVLSCALLQVSLSQCVTGEPSEELVTKYNEMKATFFARLHNFNQALRTALQPALASPEFQEIQAFFGQVDQRRMDAINNFLGTLAAEMSPLMDRARTAALGRYESCLRPQIGPVTNEIIDTIKIYLDMFLPA